MEKYKEFKNNTLECSNFQSVDQSFIDKYKDKVCNDLIEFWREVGVGEFGGGLFRLISPDDYQYFVDNYIGEEGQFSSAIPFLTTAFGDIFAWVTDVYMGESYVAFINIRQGKWTIISTDIEVLFNIDVISDYESLDENFDISDFSILAEKLGLPKVDECYGYVPAIVMGGGKSLNNVQIVKTIPYVDFICQSLGKIEFRE